ncbi:MAG: putative peptidoglycan glycosyltransferase FtsW [Patescibacteria group bacterium]
MTSAHRILLITILLCLFGALVVFEASTTESLDTYSNKYTLTVQQVKWMGVGMLALAVSASLPITFWKKVAPGMYAIGVLGLLCIFIPGIGVRVNGAHRWLQIAGFRFQPVEIMKFGMVLYFAHWLSKHQKLGPFATLTLLPVTLVMLQPDLGSTLILLSIAFGMYFVAKAPVKPLLITMVVGLVGVCILIFSSPYRMQRVTTLFNPEADPLGEGYHVHQITLALGNGGLFGTGLGQSKQKYRYIPELSTDSIFSIVAEETGFAGATVIISLFALLIFSFFTSMNSLEEHSFEYLCTAGITIWLSSQIILNLGAVVALFPLTGIPLPFISRGGTSLVTVLTAIGIFLSLTRRQITPMLKSKWLHHPFSRSRKVPNTRLNRTQTHK